MAGRKADLHIHSTFSDGTLTPEQIVDLSVEAGLAAISITDHDSIEGVEAARALGEQRGVEVVPGVEISCIEDGVDIHMLGYFLDIESESLSEHLNLFRNARKVRAEQMVAKLNELGLEITLEAVLEKAGPASIGRPHLAEVLVEGGFVASYEDVFRKYIGFGGPAYVGKYEISAARSVELIHDARGLAVIAHPGVYLRGETVAKILEAGIDGIETVHPKHSFGTTLRFREMVKELGLLETGGSDYHGNTRGNTPFADGVVPYEWVEAMKARIGA